MIAQSFGFVTFNLIVVCLQARMEGRSITSRLQAPYGRHCAVPSGSASTRYVQDVMYAISSGIGTACHFLRLRRKCVRSLFCNRVVSGTQLLFQCAESCSLLKWMHRLSARIAIRLVCPSPCPTGQLQLTRTATSKGGMCRRQRADS